MEEHLYSETDKQPYEPTPGSGFYDWRETFPQLAAISDRKEELLAEMRQSPTANVWFDWPQERLWKEGAQRWDVLPLLGFGMKVVDNLRAFPKLAETLLALPGLRTALFSRVGANTRIKPHTGPFILSSNVLRCHFGIQAARGAGIWVEGTFVQQEVGEWIVFDDAKLHSGVNESAEDKIVLILDLKRPDSERPASWPRFPFPRGLPPGWGKMATRYSAETFDPESM